MIRYFSSPESIVRMVSIFPSKCITATIVQARTEYKPLGWIGSEPIDGEKYHAEDKDNTTDSVGGYVEVGLIDELCEEHGGVDLAQTLQEEFINKK